MSLRNAFTFSGKPDPASARSRSIQSLRVWCVAANSLSHSYVCNLCVSVIGDSCAACRISSEYALPIPLTRRGSVRARFRVRFSNISAARNDVKSLVKMSIPPGSTERKPSSPVRTCNDARRLVPASVSTSDPLGKSKAARFCRPDSFAPGSRQCNRPAIIRCSTSQRSPSTPMAIRFPIRRNSRTVRLSTFVMGGCTVRSRKGLVSRTRSIGSPMMRGSRALMYAAISGSSGMLISLQLAPALLQQCHTDSRAELCRESFEDSVLLLLPKYLPVGLAVRIKAIMFAPFPCGFQFGPGDVPVRAAFPQHSSQILPKLFDGRPAKKPVAIVDFEYNETRLEDNYMRDHRIVLGVRVLGDVQILLNLAPRIG